MANAYINQGQKPRAWKVLQEAAKCDYDNWKVWDNIMVVSTDCAHFEEVIRAYHRILDVKNAKHVDTEVLKILVHAITNDLKDNYGRSSKVFKKSAKELFGRLTSENSTESRLWELYAGNCFTTFLFDWITISNSSAVCLHICTFRFDFI